MSVCRHPHHDAAFGDVKRAADGADRGPRGAQTPTLRDVEPMFGYRQPTSLKRLAVAWVSAATLLGACGSAHQSNSPVLPGASGTLTSLTPHASESLAPIDATASPTTHPTSLPNKTPPTGEVTRWSKPQRVDGATCVLSSAAIDDLGTAHVAADCRHAIHYLTSSGTGWTSAKFDHPTDRIDQGPQLAFDGKTLYLAWTRIQVSQGDCGDNGLRDVGVYVRHRELPDGKWSAAERVGWPLDGLQNLRVANGTLHLIVKDRSTGRIHYETASAGSIARYSIPGAVGGTSLRIGADGMARAAYEAAGNLQFGVFDGSGFSHSAISGSTNGWGPSLVLDAQDHAHVLWTRSYHGGGCAWPDPEPEDGTYYGTDAGGSWAFSRISTAMDGGSLALDPATGRIHVAITGHLGIRYLEKLGTGGWIETRITTGRDFGPIIRVNPTSGHVLVVYGAEDGIYTVTGS